MTVHDGVFYSTPQIREKVKGPPQPYSDLNKEQLVMYRECSLQ